MTFSPIRCVHAGLATLAILANASVAQRSPERVREVASYRALPNAKSFTMADTPDWIIGGEGETPESELDARSGGRVGVILRDGSVLLGDRVRLLKVSPRGEITASFGRVGSGPQEFRDIISLCRTRGDTVVVSDGANLRISMVAPNGVVVRTRPFGMEGQVSSTGCYANGDLAYSRTVELRSGEQTALVAKRAMPTGRFLRDSLMSDPADPDRLVSWHTAVVAIGNRTLVSDGRQRALRVYDSAGRLTARWNIREAMEEMSDAEQERCALFSVPRSYSSAQRAAIVRR